MELVLFLLFILGTVGLILLAVGITMIITAIKSDWSKPQQKHKKSA